MKERLDWCRNRPSYQFDSDFKWLVDTLTALQPPAEERSDGQP